MLLGSVTLATNSRLKAVHTVTRDYCMTLPTRWIVRRPKKIAENTGQCVRREHFNYCLSSVVRRERFILIQIYAGQHRTKRRTVRRVGRVVLLPSNNKTI